MVESPWGVEPQTYALRGRSRASLKFEVDAPTSANAFARLESTQVSAQLDPPRGRTACYGVAVGERPPRRYVAGTSPVRASLFPLFPARSPRRRPLQPANVGKPRPPLRHRIRLTLAEIRRLFNVRDQAKHIIHTAMRWSAYRHEHQADARAHHFKRHFKRRLKIQYLAL